MYKYTHADQAMVDERVEQFRDQTRRFLAGELPEEQYLPLRLQNGLYIQRHAPMLRIAVPYGLIASYQLRKLADITRRYDRGYGHFTTRTNLQLNWPKLEEVPDILAELASVQMHAIQTSGNCIRNTTTDPYAGINANEVEDPRPYCEIIRQWSTFHPEFAFLPRKFKIAVIGTPEDRAATQVHDIGLHVLKNEDGEIGFEVIVGGGLGRTPIIGKTINKFLPRQHLLSYLDAILRVYNLHGRRDNKFKARIKILVESMGAREFTKLVEKEWETFTKDGPLTLTDENFETAKSYFPEFDYENIDELASQTELNKHLEDKAFADWYSRNTVAHKVAGYRGVVMSLKAGLVDGKYVPAGDITEHQLDRLADLADQYSFGEIRGTHQQNLVFADVKQTDLYALWKELTELNLARPNIGTLTDMIVCPGFDLCALANATTYNIAEQIEKHFDDLDYLYDLGDIQLNMSGCMNACAHHHVGDIGILGVDKKGEHWYQISLGGSSKAETRLGNILGRSVATEEVAPTLEKILNVYTDQRHVEGDAPEPFADFVQRVGIKPFKEAVYG
ncbi:nitrite/sulfite reductase [Psychrobacter sanguinis]|uniref:nitrite/sulfite reductase n=1 Tax=Psychrobacter sanguinis TaxID=861445 RepID=UPI00020C9334|nr:nitrite/sulfite reductase [Psychrobacter sanguinis]EGK15335.1 sulfite reductase [NADPH] hemoprotein beta subunit [Psychrobacter sp. 1501(2011)]MCC3307836.1 nitrite/sulfite reductase [Psychrobacter sanguinis]MCC3344397.1 nitrite/sulfite reductase [Psychrobacter sanguinis]MCD9151425.1 nitrite/sulfite reductase [Psychrobacter sanguinis]MDY3307250.1 nitrite/sulfite reductase [Psychrobacter sanguinis]